jgi:uncharacterized membrane protein (DUF485 family)
MCNDGKEHEMARGGNAPTNAVWIICLILYVVALLATFGILPVAGELVRWAWIIGFGLLLLACRVRGL